MSAKISLNQHYRLSIERAKLDYRDGLITAAGLLFYAVGILRKPGQKVSMPVKDWVELTGLSERTFYKAKAKLIALGRLEERIVGTVELWIGSNLIDISCPTVQEDRPIVQGDCPNGQYDRPIVQGDCPIVPNETPKPKPVKGFSSLSSITNRSNKPPLTDEREVLKRSEENKKAAPAQTKIPADLQAKLEELGILRNNGPKQVLEAIALYDISQAYGAANHVERSYESIDNPRAVFLYQLPRQQKEAIGPRDLKTASDLAKTISIEQLKALYGAGWKAAAAHFGIEIKEDL